MIDFAFHYVISSYRILFTKSLYIYIYIYTVI
uniref:Uncharacterized protein n=1 Tax=Heterorhabditis bacteriophora TaxID=37862 RepID=A0A1I7X1D4_HETBA